MSFIDELNSIDGEYDEIYNKVADLARNSYENKINSICNDIKKNFIEEKKKYRGATELDVRYYLDSVIPLCPEGMDDEKASIISEAIERDIEIDGMWPIWERNLDGIFAGFAIDVCCVENGSDTGVYRYFDNIKVSLSDNGKKIINDLKHELEKDTIKIDYIYAKDPEDEYRIYSLDKFEPFGGEFDEDNDNIGITLCLSIELS